MMAAAASPSKRRSLVERQESDSFKKKNLYGVLPAPPKAMLRGILEGVHPGLSVRGAVFLSPEGFTAAHALPPSLQRALVNDKTAFAEGGGEQSPATCATLWAEKADFAGGDGPVPSKRDWEAFEGLEVVVLNSAQGCTLPLQEECQAPNVPLRAAWWQQDCPGPAGSALRAGSLPLGPAHRTPAPQ